MFTFFIYSFLLAVTAYIYRNFLADEPILNWWFKIGDKYHGRWFYKPIWGCEFCFAGQLALWTYLLNVLFSVILDENDLISRLIFKIIPKYRFWDFSVLSGVSFICMTIFNVWIVAKIKKLATND